MCGELVCLSVWRVANARGVPRLHANTLCLVFGFCVFLCLGSVTLFVFVFGAVPCSCANPPAQRQRY